MSYEKETKDRIKTSIENEWTRSRGNSVLFDMRIRGTNQSFDVVVTIAAHLLGKNYILYDIRVSESINSDYVEDFKNRVEIASRKVTIKKAIIAVDKKPEVLARDKINHINIQYGLPTIGYQSFKWAEE